MRGTMPVWGWLDVEAPSKAAARRAVADASAGDVDWSEPDPPEEYVRDLTPAPYLCRDGTERDVLTAHDLATGDGWA